MGNNGLIIIDFVRSTNRCLWTFRAICCKTPKGSVNIQGNLFPETVKSIGAFCRKRGKGQYLHTERRFCSSPGISALQERYHLQSVVNSGVQRAAIRLPLSTETQASLSTNLSLCLVVNWFGNCWDSFLWKQQATAFWKQLGKFLSF